MKEYGSIIAWLPVPISCLLLCSLFAFSARVTSGQYTSLLFFPGFAQYYACAAQAGMSGMP